MHTGFDWNTIPGVHNPQNGNVQLSTQSAATPGNVNRQASIDHFDDYFNSQLSINQHRGSVNGTSDTQNNNIGNLSPQAYLKHSVSYNPSTNNNNNNINNTNANNNANMNNTNNNTKNNSNQNNSSTLTSSSGNGLSNIFTKMSLNNNVLSHSDDTLDKIKSSMDSKPLKNSFLEPIKETIKHSSSTDTLIADNDSSIPLSLTINDMSPKELKTYLRWYENIQDRKVTTKIVTMDDVFKFMSNFKIPAPIKDRLVQSFSKWANSLNIGQFFALMRLLAHALHGKPLTKSLIKLPAPIPNPISILSSKRKDDSTNSENEEEINVNEPAKKLDIDSFTEFILTGEMPTNSTKKKKKNNKRVKFSDVLSFSSSPVEKEVSMENAALIVNRPEQHVLDYNLSMNDLLAKLKGEPTGSQIENSAQQQQVYQQQQQQQQQYPENEEEELKDIQIDTFKNITQRELDKQNSGDDLQPLKPNLTGSASKSMKEHFMQQFEQTFNFNNTSNSFNDISSLSAATPTGSVNQSTNFTMNAIPERPTMQTMFSSTQVQYPLAADLSPNTGNTSQSQLPKQPQESSDYFGFVPQNTQQISNFGVTNNQVLQTPQRLAGSISASPPPVPPPPRSRKSSRAAQTAIPSIPTPMAVSNNNTNKGNPILPPKPMLNEKQKKQYLSLSDEIGNSNGSNNNNMNNNMNNNGTNNNNGNQFSNMNQYNQIGMGQMNQLNMAQMGQMNQMNQMGQVNQMNQMNQVGQVGQVGQMGQMNYMNQLNNRVGGSLNQINQINGSMNNVPTMRHFNSSYAGQEPLYANMHQQPPPQQQQAYNNGWNNSQQPQQQQQTGQPGAQPNWSGWNV